MEEPLVKLIIILLLACLITSCAAPLGTVTIHSVNDKNKLESPLVSSSSLITDIDTIFKAEPDGGTDGEDVFAIYLTDTYLRYLKDLGGINEVLVVVEFTEAVTGTTNDTVTKILGPYYNIADATKSPFLNKLLYGPKKMQSDILTMNIKIYEYDLEENDNNAAMLEFIAGAASTLALADPVTLGEIKVVKEIAQTLTRTNENDLVLNMDLDFVAGNSKYKPYTSSRVLPLRDGELIVAKQEACRPGTCYDYFSQHGRNGTPNYPGYITDALMVLPTTIIRATTDVPDNSALTPFKDDKIVVNAKGLTIINDEGKANAFVDKTWLRLSIVKGGDASQWEIRKLLYPQEEEINKLLRNPNAMTMENMARFNERLMIAQQELLDAQSNIKLTSSTSLNGTHFIDPSKTNSTLCLGYSSSITIDDANSRTMGLANVVATKLSSANDSICFTLTPSPNFTAGSGQFQAVYQLSGKAKSSFFPIVIVAPISSGNFAPSCKAGDSGNYKIKLTAAADKTNALKSISIGTERVAFAKEGTEVSFTSSSKNPQVNISGILGGSEVITVSGCP